MRKKLRLMRQQQSAMQGSGQQEEESSSGEEEEVTSVGGGPQRERVSETEMAATLRTLHAVSQDLELFRSPEMKLLRAAVQVQSLFSSLPPSHCETQALAWKHDADTDAMRARTNTHTYMLHPIAGKFVFEGLSLSLSLWCVGAAATRGGADSSIQGDQGSGGASGAGKEASSRPAPATLLFR